MKDAVITVPPYFGQAQRKGLLLAAELAGINVFSLVNEHSGAALQYGIDKDFSNGSRHVVFYDMGASSTYAALVYFSAYNAKEYGKTISVNQFQVILHKNGLLENYVCTHIYMCVCLVCLRENYVYVHLYICTF